MQLQRYMKAAIRTGFTGYTLSFTEEHPQPSRPKDKDSLLIKVHAGAINPVDYKLPKMALGPVYGLDFCGTITEADPDCDGGFKAGEIVFGFSVRGESVGTLAEYTVAKSSAIARAPEGWTVTDCAALPTAHVSSLQCLRKGGIISDDDEATASETNPKSVLVIGASGGCGLAGVQLCKALGVARIVAICSGKNRDLVLEHGATEVVDYSETSKMEGFFSDNKGKFDCVLDAATNSGGGEDYWTKSLGLLKRSDDGGPKKPKIVGHYTALNGPASKWMRAMAGAQKEHETIIMKEAKGSDLAVIAKLMDKTGAKPLTKIIAFDEKGVSEGFDLLKSRRTKGKIVFDICAP